MYVGAKYAALTEYLANCSKDKVSLSTDETGRLIPLPPWVRNPIRKPWGNTTQSFAAEWRNAGYKVVHVRNDIITFAKE
jgi:hypothetical protein